MSESQLNSRDITFRTVFHDVEGIKSYLRKLRHENERVMKNIQSLVQSEVYKAFNSAATLSSMVHDAVNDIISPLKTEWVNNEFIDYIGENMSDITIDLISNNLMSIVDYNSNRFNAYINSALTSSTVGDIISPLKTEWVNDGFVDYIGNNLSDTTINLISDRFMSIVEYNSGELNAYINSAITTDAIGTLISPLKTEWVDSGFINYITGFISNSSGNIINDIQKEIADQFPEIDVKNILKDYHLIEKHCTTLASQITIDTSGLVNPESGLERFRILAYVSGENSTSELNYNYIGNAITEDAYLLSVIKDDVTLNISGVVTTIPDVISACELLNTLITVATITTGINRLDIMFNMDADSAAKSYINDGGKLWYGFTDLVNPESSTNYTVMVSIDGSPNYLPLLTSAGGHFTVSSDDKLGYISGAAEAIRNQFGADIDVVEVVPHPLLVNDSERYTVLRAITSSEQKGNWAYRVDSSNMDAYSYNKSYDRSVLKFSPLETPIMYANKKTGETITNYYIWKLDETFKNREDLYSIDLSNFVPWTTTLPNHLSTSTESTYPVFNNINSSSPNFGKLDIGNICNGCTNLASIDLRCIIALNTNDGLLNTASAFTSCGNLRTVYCNESFGNLISDALPSITSHRWTYKSDISALVPILITQQS